MLLFVLFNGGVGNGLHQGFLIPEVSPYIRDQVRKQLGLEEPGGALVGQVSPGAAQDAGIRRGDIVLMFDGVDVKNAAHLRELIDGSEDKRTVAVLVRRGDSPLFMALRLKD